MKQSRQLQIIRYLLKSNQFRTIQDIANHLNVSNRTIRHDLDALSPILQECNLTLIKKTGSGVMIEGTPQAKLTLESQIKYQHNSHQALAPRDRQIYISLRILSDEGVRILDLMDELYVSRATIQKDISEIKDTAHSFQISLERKGKQGLWFEGKERKIRNYMFDQMIQSSTFPIFESYIHNINQTCDGRFIFPGLDLTDDEIQAGFKTILTIGNATLQNYTVNNLSHLLVRVLIVCIRSNLGYSANLSDIFITELKAYPEAYEISQFLLQEQDFFETLMCDSMDVYYLQIYVVAYQQVTTLSSDNTGHIDEFVAYLINYWNHHSSVNLSQDDKLIEDLRRHMNTVDIRINYGIPIRNPLLHEIDAYYSNTYQLLQDSIRDSDLEYWQNLSKDELGFITLYLAGALERQKKSLNTLLVTEISRSAQSVLIQRVTFNIPEIKLESSITTHELKEFDLSPFDCILSTSTIDLNLPIPVIQIGNIISDDDLLRLKKLITPLFKTKNSPKRELD